MVTVVDLSAHIIFLVSFYHFDFYAISAYSKRRLLLKKTLSYAKALSMKSVPTHDGSMT